VADVDARTAWTKSFVIILRNKKKQEDSKSTTEETSSNSSQVTEGKGRQKTRHQSNPSSESQSRGRLELCVPASTKDSFMKDNVFKAQEEQN